MAGSITVSSITLDSDNNFSILSNTGATLFFANTTGIDVANSIGATAITNDKILSVANTKISGNIISSQIASVNGSVITANTIANSAIQTGAVENYLNAAGLGFGMRNRIINGAMVIDQRNAGASVTPADQAYTLDRWVYIADQASKCTIEQTISGVSAPAGFSNYLGVTSTAATTITTSQVFGVVQRIEGYNMADFAWGTASAATVTLSFWVRSSLTGTFGGSLRNDDGNYNYPFSYTISSANTWEQKSVTITGATSGTWLTTNGRAMQVVFGLGAGATVSGTAGAWSTSNFWSATGATQVLATNGATFYITGVQLEKGSTATSFDYRPYGTELALCQRYYCKSYQIGTVPQTSTTLGVFAIVAVTSPSSGQAGVGGGNKWPVQMRTTPTVTIYSQIGTAGKLSSGGADNGTSVTSEAPSEFGAVGIVSSSGLTNNNWYYGHFVATAEL